MNTETIDYVLHLIISDLSVLKRKLKDYREFIKEPICDKVYWSKEINSLKTKIDLSENSINKIKELLGEEKLNISKSELIRRRDLIISEPDGITRETMINNLLI